MQERHVDPRTIARLRHIEHDIAAFIAAYPDTWYIDYLHSTIAEMEEGIELRQYVIEEYAAFIDAHKHVYHPQATPLEPTH